MERRRLGESDLEVSPICLGTMTFGQQNDEAEAHELLDIALDRGVNFFDTAELYAVPACAETYGDSERILGKWLRRQPRERVVVATKVAGPGRKLEWIRGGPLALDGDNIRDAVEQSLRRLQTDYIDLYQIHWPARNQPMFGQWQYDPARERDATPIHEQLRALKRLVDQGKIRWVGLSNEHPWGVAEFLRCARDFGLPRVVSIQNAYNLLNRVFDYGLAELCHRERVGLLAYSPLAFGHLTGKYLERADAPGRLNAFPGFGARYDKPGVEPALRAYRALASAAGLSLTGLALAFVYRRWMVASTIIGATCRRQLHENLDAWALRLDEATLSALDEIHLRHGNPAP